MQSKYSVVSIILFSISLILFVIFAFTIFFGGQQVGGAIYFIYFAIMLAFAFLDRKYASNFTYLYRYSSYISSAFNILATASIIFYKQHLGFMIATCAILSAGLLVDICSKNRSQKRLLGSILLGINNCALMFTIFPYFFMEELPKDEAIAIIIVSSVMLLLKIILALTTKEQKQVKDKEDDLVEKVRERANSEEEL